MRIAWAAWLLSSAACHPLTVEATPEAVVQGEVVSVQAVVAGHISFQSSSSCAFRVRLRDLSGEDVDAPEGFTQNCLYSITNHHLLAGETMEATWSVDTHTLPPGLYEATVTLDQMGREVPHSASASFEVLTP